jgi:hypothetical protein
MLIIDTLIVLVALFIIASIQARMIKQNKRIDHDLWLVIYLVFVVIISLLAHHWPLIGVAIFVRAVVFDSMLNLLRGDKWNYVSSSTTSKTDKWEYKIFKGNFILEKAVYLAITVIYYIIVTLIIK